MIVVTGATGHIGNVVVRKLIQRGETVRALSQSKKSEAALHGLPCERRYGKLDDMDFLLDVFKGASAVLHLAGFISIMPGNKATLQEVNVNGTRNVLQACRQLGTPRLVYASSTHALREIPPGVPMYEGLETDWLAANGDYARSKIQATLSVFEAAQNGLDAVVVYPSGVLGPFDFKPSESGSRIRQILKGSLRFRVDGAYNFVDVRDVANGILAALDKGKQGEGYTLSGSPVSVKAFFDMAARSGGQSRLILPVPWSLAYGAAVVVEQVAKPLGIVPSFTTYALRVLKTNADIRHDKAGETLGYRSRPIRETFDDHAKWLRGEAVSLD